MSLKLLRMVHVGTQDPLHDIGLGAVLDRMLAPKDLHGWFEVSNHLQYH
jgi:hypothetical protein